jgi:hypothetical protein
MRPSLKLLALALPFLAVACNPSPYRVGGPPPQGAEPPVATGALGAPYAPPGTVVASSGSTTAPIANPSAPMRMSATDIAATLSNNTATGMTTNGNPYAIYFAGNGQERFREGAFNDAGTWRVLPDGRLCSALVRLNSNNEECYIMYRTGNTVSFQAPDGVSVGSIAVTPGNPQNL